MDSIDAVNEAMDALEKHLALIEKKPKQKPTTESNEVLLLRQKIDAAFERAYGSLLSARDGRGSHSLKETKAMWEEAIQSAKEAKKAVKTEHSNDRRLEG